MPVELPAEDWGGDHPPTGNKRDTEIEFYTSQ